MTAPDAFHVYDTTLRDGAQQEGLNLSVSDKLGDAFCMIPIYGKHLNLGFNKGTLLPDPHRLLTGTGNLIRHIDVHGPEDYRNTKVEELIVEAVALAIHGMGKPTKVAGKTVSKIKVS